MQISKINNLISIKIKENNLFRLIIMFKNMQEQQSTNIKHKMINQDLPYITQFIQRPQTQFRFIKPFNCDQNQSKQDYNYTETAFTKTTFDNGYLQKQKYLTLAKWAKIQAYLLISNTFSLYIYYELSFKNNQYHTYFLTISFFINLLIASLQLIAFIRNQDERKLQFTYQLVKCAVKIVIIGISNPLPWNQHTQIALHYNTYEYEHRGDGDSLIKINFAVLLFTFLRNILMIIPCLCFNLFYYQPRAQRIFKIYSQSKQMYLFASKCIFNDRPMLCIFINFVITVLYFSFSIRLIQRNAACNGQYFSYYQNSIWFIMISICTVGFGQVTVCTAQGQCIIIFAVLIGVFDTSLIIVLALNLFQFSYDEIEIFNVLKNQQYTLQYREKCKKYIRITLWRLWKKYRGEWRGQRCKEELTLKRKLASMRNELRGRISEDNNLLFNRMQTNFIQTRKSSSILIQNNYRMLNFINSLFLDQSSNFLSITCLKNQLNQKQRKYTNNFLTNKIKNKIALFLKDQNGFQTSKTIKTKRNITENKTNFVNFKIIDLQKDIDDDEQ